MCFRIEILHGLCSHTDIIIIACEHTGLCSSTDYPRSGGYRYPVQTIAVIPMRDLGSRCRECYINHTLLNEPSPLESELIEALVEDAEVEDRYWRGNESIVHIRDTASQPQENPAAIVSSRVRRWREGLPLEGFEDYDVENDRGVVSFFEDAMYGFSRHARFEIEDSNIDPEGGQIFQMSLSAVLNAFPINDWPQDTIVRGHVDKFLTGLPVIDMASMAEDDRRCGICFQAYLPNEVEGALRAGERPVRLLCAGRHLYGIDCLKAWFIPSRNPKLSCPACREDIFIADDEDIGQRIR